MFNLENVPGRYFYPQKAPLMLIYVAKRPPE